MDLEANPIQIQTPPIEDDIDAPAEQGETIEPSAMDDQPAEEEATGITEEAPHDDEIVVEDDHGQGKDKNDAHNRESPLSSAPPSEAEAAAAEAGRRNLIFVLKSRHDT